MDRSQSGGNPLGGRIWTDKHEWAKWRAETCKTAGTFKQFEVLQLLERIGKRLPPTESGARWTDPLIAHYRLLVLYTQEQDWHESKPIVWLSVAETARKLNIEPRQVNRNENQLMELGVLTWSDSPNHKRFGSRDRDGSIIRACGVNLMPSVNMAKDLRQFEYEIEQSDKLRKTNKDNLMTERRAIKSRLYYLFDAGLKSHIEDIADQITKIINDIRVTSKTTIKEIQNWLNAIKEKRQDLEDRLKSQVSGVQGQNMTSKVDLKDCQGRHESPAQIIQRKSERIEDTSTVNDVSGELPDENGTLPSRQCQSEKRRSRDVDQRQKGTCNGLSNINWRSFTDSMHQRVQDKMPDNMDKHQLSEIAINLKNTIGISDHAWGAACQAFGDRQTTAIVILMIATKYYSGTVKNPGGYLRGITDKQRDGRFKIWSMIIGLNKLRPQGG